MKKNLLVILLIAISNFTFSQNIIKGKITDNKTQKPIEFVNIFVLNNQYGTISDKNGNYELTKLPKNNKIIKIQFSLIGYKTVLKTINIENKSQVLNISMEPTILKTEEVVISGGTYSTQHENAISIESISPTSLQKSGSPSIIKTLTKRPGLDMIAKSPGVAKPVIRGLSMTNILLLNNGVKLENFQFSEDHPFIIDEYGIDKIEIIKGPASILYGSDAVGGVINFIKEKPATLNKIKGDFHQQYHSNTQGIVSNLGIKGNKNNIIWGFRSGIKSHKDYIDGNDKTVCNSRFNEKSAKANIGIIRPFGSFKIFYDYNYDQLGMTVPPAINSYTTNDRKNKEWFQNLHNHVLSLRNKFFIGNQQLEINTAYQNNNRQLITSNNMPADTMVDLTLQTFSYDLKTHWQTSAKTNFILGIQGDIQKNTNNDAPSHIIPDATTNNIGIITLLQTKIFNKINTQAGLRYDIQKINIPNQTYSVTNAYDSSIFFPMNLQYQNFSFTAGATYNINKLWLIRLNAASAYRAPNLAELTQNGLHGLRYEIGNPKMTPQRNYEGDLAIHFHNNNISINISPFYNIINNYIYISPTNDTTTDNYRIYRYEQTNAVIYGSELSSEYVIKKLLKLNISYSYLVGLQSNGNYLPFIPQNKLHANLTYNFKDLKSLKKPFISAGILFADKQNTPSIFETKTDSYYVINISAGGKIKINKLNLDLSININNLLNKKYYDHLSTLKEVGFYNIGRNISINLNIPFDLK